MVLVVVELRVPEPLARAKVAPLAVVVLAERATCNLCVGFAARAPGNVPLPRQWRSRLMLAVLLTPECYVSSAGCSRLAGLSRGRVSFLAWGRRGRSCTSCSTTVLLVRIMYEFVTLRLS